MRRRLLLFSCIFNLAVASAQSLDSDSLLVTLGTELRYNMSQLQQQPNNIPYFMSLRLVDEQSTIVRSNLGAATVNTAHSRIITPQIRLGDEALDNFKYQNQGSGDNQRNGQGINIPVAGGVAPLSDCCQ